MNIGLYFGSFNPIHIGHLIIANHVIEHSDIDKIWFVLSPHNPLKDEKSLLNEYDRLNLVNLAIEEDPRFRASNIEFGLSKPSYTANTLIHLNEKFPLEKFHIIMGSDSYMNLKNWKNSEFIIQNYPIIVYRRPGFNTELIENSQTQFMDAPMLELSSTEIRKSITENKSIKYLTPEKVRKYIEESKYYL